MKKLLVYSLLAAVLFGNSGAGCSSKNADDPQPGNDIKLLVGGLWEVAQTLTFTPSDKITLKLKKGALGFKFYADGKLESCSFGTCSAIGRWSFLLQSQSKGTGTLTMYIENPDVASIYGNKMEGYLDISIDNFVRWVVKGNPTIGDTDATQIQWTMERNP
ncbi:hypothetical protein [Spirosoma arcticum]